MSTPAPARRPDASMTLLTSMMERPLDPGYAAAAQSRRAAGLPPATTTRTPLAIVCALVVGLILSVGASTLRAKETTGAKVRADLISQINKRRALADERVASSVKLQREISDLENATLRQAQLGGLASELTQLRLTQGVEPVHGPGLVVTLDDAPKDATDGQDTGTQGKVLSRDVFIVTNGLWAAGAEAIAINGQRLTAHSAIRFAGDAILVNFRPLVPPYKISAIGDPKAMPAAFASGVAGTYIKSLSDNFGMVTDTTTATDLVLPSATLGNTSLATPLPGGGSK